MVNVWGAEPSRGLGWAWVNVVNFGVWLMNDDVKRGEALNRKRGLGGEKLWGGEEWGRPAPSRTQGAALGGGRLVGVGLGKFLVDVGGA